MLHCPICDNKMFLIASGEEAEVMCGKCGCVSDVVNGDAAERLINNYIAPERRDMGELVLGE